MTAATVAQGGDGAACAAPASTVNSNNNTSDCHSTSQAAAGTQQSAKHQRPPPTRRIAVIECEDAERWRGYTESLWKAALQEEGDEWTMFQACSGDLPTPSEAASFDAMLVSGSHYSVYEDLPWIQQLLDLLPQYAATGVRIYGCCFGCQILAQALGGSVGPNPDGAFVLTIERVTLTPQLSSTFKQLGPVLQPALASTAEAASPPADAGATVRETAAEKAAAAATTTTTTAAAAAAAAAAADDRGSSSQHDSGSSRSSSQSRAGNVLAVPVIKHLSDLSVQDSSTGSRTQGGSSDDSSSRNAACAGGCFRLIESHGDQVLSLPPGAVVLATSPSAPYELWAWGSNVLASQFHLEFTEPLVLDKIWTRLRDVGRLDSQQAEHSRRTLEAGGQHNVQMLQVVKHFLKHGLE